VETEGIFVGVAVRVGVGVGVGIGIGISVGISVSNTEARSGLVSGDGLTRSTRKAPPCLRTSVSPCEMTAQT